MAPDEPAAPRSVIGVFGSGTESHVALAAPLGRAIAQRGFHLLTGGGGGVMEAVCEAYVSVSGRRGVCVGVLPGPDARPGYPNRFVELPIRTHLPHVGAMGADPRSRNHLNVLLAGVFIVVGGEGGGTT